MNLRRYCEHCSSRDLKKRSALVHLSLGDRVSCLDALLSARMAPLAARFLQACSESPQGPLPDTSHSLVLQEETALAYARHLFDCGNSAAAFHYCSRADEKGEVLRREMEAMMGGGRRREEAEE